ncbi:hypothetical protein [Proteiniphilum acetatigenes]|uniref:hypothetical protein n=1 Tax=Proteiniphilum acetatigenes TaxID=294710 RepID=UPI0003A1165E|nr:hypothetical protein [Proteiniphilum acetatigenes]
MKKIYQRRVDQGHGDCMQAAMASLFDDEYENVPAFIEHNNWFELFCDYVESKGYEYDGMLHNKTWGTLMNPTFECLEVPKFDKWSLLTDENLKNYQGVDGLFYASVLSPKYFNWSDMDTHAVICDTDLNIVHDPNKDYENIRAYPLSSVIGCNGIINVSIFKKK